MGGRGRIARDLGLALLMALGAGCDASEGLRGLCLPATCTALGLRCGSAPDGCGGTVRCGECAVACTPLTCAAQGADCGEVPDGCGGSLDCGSCGAALHCGGGGTPNVCGRPAPTVPGAPREVVATAGNANATVRWHPPAHDGGSRLLRYAVTALPGGERLETDAAQTSARFSGLLNGLHYRFEVEAHNAVGPGPAALSNPAVPTRPCVWQPGGSWRAFPTGRWPKGLAVGDLNGDGRGDLAVANMEDDSLSVLLHQGGADFAPQVRYPVAQPQAVAVADLDGDGLQDVAVAGTFLSVLLSRRTGVLEPAVTYSEGGTHLAAVDLDEDGRVDLVVGDRGTPRARVLLNQGAGRFGAAVAYGAHVPVRALVAGDVDADGHVDLVLAQGSDFGIEGTVEVLLGRGDGTLSARPAVRVALEQPTSLALLDLDDDGALDLAVGSELSFFPAFALLLNQGGGRLALGNTYQDGPSFRATAVADFTWDGRPDVVIAGYLTEPGHTVSLLPSRGDGTLRSELNLGQYLMESVVAHDVDGDGRPDLLFTSYDDSVKLLLTVCE